MPCAQHLGRVDKPPVRPAKHGDQGEHEKRQFDLRQRDDQASFAEKQGKRAVGQAQRQHRLADGAVAPQDHDPGEGAHDVAGQHGQQRGDQDEGPEPRSRVPVEQRDRHADQRDRKDDFDAQKDRVDQHADGEGIGQERPVIGQRDAPFGVGHAGRGQNEKRRQEEQHHHGKHRGREEHSGVAHGAVLPSGDQSATTRSNSAVQSARFLLMVAQSGKTTLANCSGVTNSRMMSVNATSLFVGI